MDKFLQAGEKILLKRKDIIIKSGEINPNIYILQDGIVRNCYFNGLNEITIGFGLPGTMIIDMHSYYKRKPAFYQVDACCKSSVLKFTRCFFDKMLAESHEFALWVLSMQMSQLYLYEMKNSIIVGDAREKLELMIKNRPEIIKKVPLGIIASYLGITQSYLSRLRKQIS